MYCRPHLERRVDDGRGALRVRLLRGLASSLGSEEAHDALMRPPAESGGHPVPSPLRFTGFEAPYRMAACLSKGILATRTRVLGRSHGKAVTVSLIITILSGLRITISPPLRLLAPLSKGVAFSLLLRPAAPATSAAARAAAAAASVDVETTAMRESGESSFAIAVGMQERRGVSLQEP